MEYLADPVNEPLEPVTVSDLLGTLPGYDLKDYHLDPSVNVERNRTLPVVLKFVLFSLFVLMFVFSAWSAERGKQGDSKMDLEVTNLVLSLLLGAYAVVLGFSENRQKMMTVLLLLGVFAVTGLVTSSIAIHVRNNPERKNLRYNSNLVLTVAALSMVVASAVGFYFTTPK